MSTLEYSAKTDQQKCRRNHHREDPEYGQRFRFHSIRDYEDSVDEHRSGQCEQNAPNASQRDLTKHGANDQPGHIPVTARELLSNVLCRRQPKTKIEQARILEQCERQPEKAETGFAEVAHDYRHHCKADNQWDAEPRHVQYRVSFYRPFGLREHHRLADCIVAPRTRTS